MGMPHPLGGESHQINEWEAEKPGPLAWGCGMGLDGTAASYRRYTGLGGSVLLHEPSNLVNG